MCSRYPLALERDECQSLDDAGTDEIGNRKAIVCTCTRIHRTSIGAGGEVARTVACVHDIPSNMNTNTNVKAYMLERTK